MGGGAAPGMPAGVYAGMLLLRCDGSSTRAALKDGCAIRRNNRRRSSVGAKNITKPLPAHGPLHAQLPRCDHLRVVLLPVALRLTPLYLVQSPLFCFSEFLRQFGRYNVFLCAADLLGRVLHEVPVRLLQAVSQGQSPVS